MYRLLVVIAVIAGATASFDSAVYSSNSQGGGARGWVCGASERTGRSFITNRETLWEKVWTGAGTKVIVPFTLDAAFEPFQRQIIVDEINEFNQISCVQWVPRNDDFLYGPSYPPSVKLDYVRFTRSLLQGECSSRVGRQRTGAQNITLGDACFTHRVSIQHEMMHALGFIHEHSREDRDCYVRLIGQIPGDLAHNYAREPEASLEFPYDTNSIMQYRTPNIVGIHGEQIGPDPDGTLSNLDRMKLKYLHCGGPSYCEVVGEQQCYNFLYAVRQCRRRPQ